MAESTVEKKLLYLVLCSVLLHGVIFALLLYLPPGGLPPVSEPLMVDLQDMPTLLPPREPAPPASTSGDEFRPAPREMAPRGTMPRDLPASPPLPGGAVQQVTPRVVQQPGTGPGEQPLPERSPGESLFRSKGKGKPAESVNLYPSAARMARIEEGYRKKYDEEVARGTTSFLNTDDILFGSFLRRFENAVYGVWRYPPEASKLGIEGVTPVRITFNRRGEIVGRELLQSSGSKILDDEVLRTLSQIGVVGSFPRGYDRETFNLIAFFHYGITGGVQRSLH